MRRLRTELFAAPMVAGICHCSSHEYGFGHMQQGCDRGRCMRARPLGQDWHRALMRRIARAMASH